MSDALVATLRVDVAPKYYAKVDAQLRTECELRALTGRLGSAAYAEVLSDLLAPCLHEQDIHKRATLFVLLTTVRRLDREVLLCIYDNLGLDTTEFPHVAAALRV